MVKTNPVDTALDCVERIAVVRDVATLIDETKAAIKPFGFKWFLIGDLPEPIGGSTVRILASSWPDAWRKRYVSESYYDIDPVARHARGTTEPFLWSDVRWDAASDPRAGAMMDDCKAHGLSQGFVVPVMAANGELGVVSLVAGRVSMTAEKRRALQLIAIYAHHRACVLSCTASSADTAGQFGRLQ